jgi:hypothetical protein
MGARYGQRPSTLLEMREAGYGPDARLSVDEAIFEFSDRWHRMAAAKKEVPDHERPRRARPMKLVPMYDEAFLLRLIDLDPTDELAKEILASVQPAEIDWESDELGDWDDLSDDDADFS